MKSSPPPVAGEPGDDTQAPDPARAKRRRKIRRRATGGALLLGGLSGAGLLAAVLTPTPQVATANEEQTALVREGEQLYDQSCITCHGANLQGVDGRGPSLIGVGEASVYFQVASGRMPASQLGAQMPRKKVEYSEQQIDALGAFVQAHGGGPTVPRNADGEVASDSLRGSGRGEDMLRASDAAVGGDLFRQNCASCHNFTGQGGTLSSGKHAPDLNNVPEAQIYTAMLTGPENMPKFSDRQLTPDEKKDIIAYVKGATEAHEPGGLALGGFGPAAEAGVIWAVGIVAAVGAALWIGARS
ncbi:cytochrome bc1 complex diheme cytochrome c subunit [Tomitella gaofuii]|uniref:cytochrome bc1 complex diheme cytochrome c subunit n=1 Tax=Tomitella gaofuii TaxID=2760083 RepID=UPI0015F7A288|nr:cytochrome c [Tomitella gaofuii]